MLFPENPEKRPTLWDSMSRQLAHEAMCFVVGNGHGDPLAAAQAPGDDVAQQALTRLRASQICRISANRGAAMSPHFAGKRDGESVFVTEFLSLPSDGAQTITPDQLQRDLEVAAINLLFAEKGVNTVMIPLRLNPWHMQDAEVCTAPDGLMFVKKSTA